MEDFLAQEYYGNTVMNWGVSLCYVVGAIIAGKLLYWFSSKVLKRLTAKTQTNLDDILIDMLEEPVIYAIISFGVWIGIERLNLDPNIDAWFDKLFTVVITINVTWLVSRVFTSLIDEYVRPLVSKSESDLDDQVLPILKKGINVIIWIFGIIAALSNAGYDVGALIAGLGIGGLALAMAAKDTVSNIFGGFTIFTDKPFKMGDRIKICGIDGTVIEIGIRSFRLRTLDGTVVTIPNCKITDNAVENITLEPTRKITTNLGLTYNTSTEDIQRAMSILKEIATADQGITEDYKIAFTDLSSYSLNVQLVYFIKKDADIQDTRTRINFDIYTKFKQNNINFAFPTQTIVLDK